MLKSFAVAFSMYSKIPMPQFAWTEQNMQYALCFFPVIGLVIGGIEYLWHLLCVYLNFGNLLFASGVVVIPFLITGGIHFDGFMDTSDAMSSWREREDRLRILKDSHIGAFAVICAACYLLLALGFASAISETILPILCMVFAMARCFSGLALLTFPNANPKGTAAAFGKSAAARPVKLVLSLILVLCAAAVICLQPVLGALEVVAVVCVFWYYHAFCMKFFGGLTGDLAGYFVSVCELVTLVVCVFGDRIMGVLR